MNLFDQLAAPFDPDLISWRAQSVTRDGDKAQALCYIDARDVMKRLDHVMTPAGWEDRYEETAKGRVICTLSLKIDGVWVAKADGAGDTDVEGEKGGISDAFKRAAVKWGIGRYLYDVSAVWAPCVSQERDHGGRKKLVWKSWKPEAHGMFDQALAKVAKPKTGPITDVTRDWLTGQVEAHGVNAGDLLKHLSPSDFRDITYEQLPDALAWLKSQRKAA